MAKELEVEFIKEFVSTDIGNVYIGKKAKVNEKLAKHFVNHGLAEYVTADKKAKSKKKDDKKGKNKKKDKSIALLGSDIQPEMFLLKDKTEIQLSDIIGKVFEETGLSAEDWNKFVAEDNEMAEALIQEEVDKLDLAGE